MTPRRSLPAALRAFRRTHTGFLTLLVLFVTFRVMAVLLFRPGGFIADNSDYDFYQLWGEQIPRGYTTFVNLWTAYPPLFPALMLPVWEWSARLAPWLDYRLAFHTLFGLELTLFEVGNLILLYRLGGGLGASAAPGRSWPAGLRAATFYALCVAPLFTMLGWFEAMPIFFLLLALDLLLSPVRGGWAASAVAAALGFLVKLTPVILLPIAVRWLGMRLSLQALRHEWFNFRQPAHSLLRPLLYGLLFALVVVGVGLPLAGFNTELALSSFRVNAIRPPWQSVWAIIDGFWGYGLVPVSMLNLEGLRSGGQWTSRIPWTLVTGLFLLFFLWLYTRPYDWSRPRTAVVQTGLGILWLFLLSKGWSPQFIVWIVVFVAVLQPSLLGATVISLLTALNFVEAYIYLILLPDERWLLVATVTLRTLALLLLGAHWLGQIWPPPLRAAFLLRWSRRLLVLLTLSSVVILGAGTPRLLQAYGERRLAEHGCRPAIDFFRAEEQAIARTLVTTQIELWRELYPWLHERYDLRVLDGYSSQDRPADEVMGEQLAAILAEAKGELWLIERGALEQPWPGAVQQVLDRGDVHLFDARQWGDCRAVRLVELADSAAAVDNNRPGATPVATFAVAGGPIWLRHGAGEFVAAASPVAQQQVEVVLYWEAADLVAGDYTVFVHLIDGQGRLLAQQDNMPVGGSAPTSGWPAQTLIRDNYRIALPEGVAAGPLTVAVGLYDAVGRRPVTLADGTTGDQWTFSVSHTR
jgi:hypothetical protein